MSLQIDCHGMSHVGRKRQTNEDQFLIADLNKSMRVFQTSLGLSHQTRLFGGSQGKLLLVADGLGGHESGERASTLAVDGVANYILNAMNWFFRLDPENEQVFEEELKEAFFHTQSNLDREASAIPQRKGMATTLTLGYVDWPNLYVVHVGDTRCYRISGNSIKQLTTDHSLAQLAATSAGANDDLPTEGRMSNILWNVVGGDNETLQPEFLKTELEVGDSILLCSDGLTRYLGKEELLSVVSAKRPTSETCQNLIEIANDRGGSDNITVVLARFERKDPELEAQAATGLSMDQSNDSTKAALRLADTVDLKDSKTDPNREETFEITDS